MIRVTDGCLRRRVRKTLYELELFSQNDLWLDILFKVRVYWIACVSWHICKLLDNKLWPAALFIPSSSSGPGIFSVKMSNLNQEKSYLKMLVAVIKMKFMLRSSLSWLTTNSLQKEADIIHNLGKVNAAIFPGIFGELQGGLPEQLSAMSFDSSCFSLDYLVSVPFNIWAD